MSWVCNISSVLTEFRNSFCKELCNQQRDMENAINTLRAQEDETRDCHFLDLARSKNNDWTKNPWIARDCKHVLLEIIHHYIWIFNHTCPFFCQTYWDYLRLIMSPPLETSHRAQNKHHSTCWLGCFLFPMVEHFGYPLLDVCCRRSWRTRSLLMINSDRRCMEISWPTPSCPSCMFHYEKLYYQCMKISWEDSSRRLQLGHFNVASGCFMGIFFTSKSHVVSTNQENILGRTPQD